MSREGVTAGVRDEAGLRHLRRRWSASGGATALPVVVGFGIASRPQVAEVAAHADGVVVGSALVNVIHEHLAANAAKIVPAGMGAKVPRTWPPATAR